jgi:hypothetical protein
MADHALRATLEIAAILDQLGLDYLVGGSLASSLHGTPRSTEDADIALDLPAERVAELIEALEGRFYVDEERARSAVARQASFNVIHLETMFKVDLFVIGRDSLGRAELARRQRHAVGPEAQEIAVASAEDTVLQKLLWYRLGNEVSDRQWRDLVGVLRVQGGRIDRRYLSQWAAKLGLEGLLAEALAEAREGGSRNRATETDEGPG